MRSKEDIPVRHHPTGGHITAKIEYRPIGVIHTPFKNCEGMPIQPAGADGVQGTVEVF